MAWYRAGTCSLTSGSPAVTGAGGTAWAANIQAGDAFLGPDGKTIEVQSVNSDASITLARNYAGATASLQEYDIIPTQGRVRDLAAQVLQLITDYGDVAGALTVLAGRVGLGKSPHASAKLDVAGQVWVDSPSGDAILRLLVSAVEKGKLAVTSAGRVYIESNGAEVMNWLNGLAGIACTPVASGGKLQLGGDIGFTSNNWAIGYQLAIQSGLISGAISPYYGLNFATFTGMAGPGAGLHGYYGAIISTSGVERVRVDSAGNVIVSAPTSGTAVVVNGVSGGVGQRWTDGAAYTIELKEKGGAWMGGGGGNVFSIGANDAAHLKFTVTGDCIFTAPPTPPTLSIQYEVVMNMTSNTNLRVSGRGSDGVTRAANFPMI